MEGPALKNALDFSAFNLNGLVNYITQFYLQRLENNAICQFKQVNAVNTN
jgi:hypothetical protein